MKAHAVRKKPVRQASKGIVEIEAALDLAGRFDAIFWEGLASQISDTAPWGPERMLFPLVHQSLTLNRNLAAHLAPLSLPATAVEDWFVAAGIERKKDLLKALQLSASTLSRAKPDTMLDSAVTERMLRQSDLFVRAAEVFGEDGATWMTKPHDMLDGKTPVEYASNEFGGAKVREILNAIEYGGVV
jgi:putative toxin-antitoxin system antitoxin component (TIGR02293 family)